MGILSTVLGVIGFGVGFLVGLVVGYFLFIRSKLHHVEVSKVKLLQMMESRALKDILPEIPFWVKCPDYERVDWLNKYVTDMWPCLDKAISSAIRSTMEPIFADYIGKYMIKKIKLEHVTLGCLPPVVHGVKIYETNGNHLVIEPAFKWAGNLNIILLIKLAFLEIRIQLVDFQIFALPRITLQPLVPTFPCFANILVSLMDETHVDFGLNVIGADVMSIPGFYHLVQKLIKNQISSVYLWPQTYEISVLDGSIAALKKPVGILHVKVVRAMKLMKADFLGKSDPYVKLSLSGNKLHAKKTTIQKNTLNPHWNESFKLIVHEPESQVLQIQVYDWDKIGAHDRLGRQEIPLCAITPHETEEFILDLLDYGNNVDRQCKKKRGQIDLVLTYVPLRGDSIKFSRSLDKLTFTRSEIDHSPEPEVEPTSGAGLLSVTVYGANNVEGKRHTNPYASIIFRGEKKRTKAVRKTRDPRWAEEFQYTLDHPPVNEKIMIEVLSRRSGFGFLSKESLGHIEINLADLVNNGRINEKYHLMESRNGVIHVDLQWSPV